MNKIIIVTSNIAPYRLRWAEELSKHFDVTIFYTKDHDYERDDRWLKNSSESCKVIKLNNKKDKYDPICFDLIGKLKEDENALVIFDGYGPKTNLLGLIYCKLYKRKSFVNVDGYPTERKPNKLKNIVLSFIIGKICTNFFCSGEATKEHLLRLGAKETSITIHNLSSITKEEIISEVVNKESQSLIRKKLGIHSTKKIVLSVGRFLPLKRFEDLILAVKKCQTDCDLYILGGKPTARYLELVGDSTSIHFIDFVLPEDVNEYYKAANLFVLPSETDVWGLVLNEAMSKGLPVIASDSVVGGKSLIKDNGYIFKTYDIDELARDIDSCLDDKNNIEMAKKSLEIIKDFTIEGMVERQLPIISKYFKL